MIPAQAGIGGVLVAGFLILAICVWNFWYLILETNDRIPADLDPLIPKSFEAARYENELRIGVYDSAATRLFYRQMRFDYESLLKSWRTFLGDMGFSYQAFRRIDELRDYDLIILPFTSCLSDYEADRIKEFVSQGGRLFMTGTVGARFEDGSWRDEPVFGDIVGARFVGNANPSPQGPARLNLNRDLPVSLRWTPRRSLEIATYNEVLVVRPIGTRMNIVASAPFYREDDSYDELAAICYGSYLKGRIVWSGIRIGAAPIGDETAERAFRELFSNLMIWLTDRPRVTTPTWPAGKRAALGLVIQASDSSPLRLVSQIKQVDAPLGVLVTPRQARAFAEMPGLRGLPIEWILHLDRPLMNIIRSANPNARVDPAKRRVERLLNTRIRGVMVEGMRPREFARMGLDAGFDYILAPPTDGIEEYPEIYASKRERGPFAAPEVLSLAPFRTSIPEKVSPTDCFFVLLQAEEFLGLEAEEQSLAILGREDIWTTQPHEIVSWRSDRNAVVMDEEFLPDQRLRVRISNGSYSEFAGFPLNIDFGESFETVLIWPKAVGQPPPVLLSNDAGDWSYQIERFRPGMTLEYIFTPQRQTESK